MRKTYRSEFTNYCTTEGSYIRKYLGSEVREILCPTADSLSDIPFDELYIPLPYIEERINEVKENPIDQCVFLTGLTGCGKSSVLNKHFHIEREKIHIDGKTLVIPFSFDNSVSTRTKEGIRTYFIAVIRSACGKLQEEMMKMNISQSNQELYEYIKSVKGELLALSSDDVSIDECLSILKNDFPLEASLLLLKYRLSCLKTIKKVIVIIDDIESIGASLELVPVDIGLFIWSCMKNQPKDASPIWTSSIVISCRHYVYRMIRERSINELYTINSNITSQTLESYPIDNEINISQPAKLMNIVMKRIEALQTRRPSTRLTYTKEVIEYILIRIDSNFGELITSICTNNIRKALDVLNMIVLNKRWIQRDYVMPQHTYGAFDIEINNYNLTHPCLLRAFALGEGIIYDNSSYIPNILKNELDSNSDLITLFVFIAFLNKGNDGLQDWQIDIDRDLVEQELRMCLPIQSHQYIRKASNYLIMKRLLLRSKVQAQDDGLDITESNVDDIRHVYTARAAYQLWALICKSSVLFELLSDDIYFDYNLPLEERSQYSVFDTATYKRCLELLDNLIAREAQLRTYANNHGHADCLNQLLGPDFLTSQLLKGLQESRNAYYRLSSEDHYQNSLDTLRKKISEYAQSLHS